LLQAEIDVKRKAPQDAIATLNGLLERNPEYVDAYRMMAQVYRSFDLDSAKGLHYLEEYNKRSSEQMQ